MLPDGHPFPSGIFGRSWPARKLSPGRGSRASASRRQTGHRRCRNARVRRGRCEMYWAAAPPCDQPLLDRTHDRCLSELERRRKELSLGHPCSPDECADLVRILFAWRAFDARGYIHARRTCRAQRFHNVVRVKPAGEHERNASLDVLEKRPVEWLAQTAGPGRLLGRTRVEDQPIDELRILADWG